jgi:hypothetical protein
MFNHAYFKTCIKKPPVRRSDDDYDLFDGDQQGASTCMRRVAKNWPVYAKNASILCIALFHELYVIKQQIYVNGYCLVHRNISTRFAARVTQ